MCFTHIQHHLTHNPVVNSAFSQVCRSVFILVSTSFSQQAALLQCLDVCHSPSHCASRLHLNATLPIMSHREPTLYFNIIYSTMSSFVLLCLCFISLVHYIFENRNCILFIKIPVCCMVLVVEGLGYAYVWAESTANALE